MQFPLTYDQDILSSQVSPISRLHEFFFFFSQRAQLPCSQGMAPQMLELLALPFSMCSAQQSEVPALLLLRGNPNSCFYFRTVVLRLQVKKHHCLAPQHRCSLGSSSSYPFPTLGRSVLHQEKELGHFFFPFGRVSGVY